MKKHTTLDTKPSAVHLTERILQGVFIRELIWVSAMKYIFAKKIETKQKVI